MTVKEHFRFLWDDELFKPKFTWRKFRVLLGILLAEMAGVAFFIFLGCSATIGKDSNHLSTSLTFSFGILGAICMVFHISGAVMNPCLVLALLILRKISIYRAILYVVFELIGSILGVGLNYIIFKDIPSNFCMTLPFVEEWRALFAEILFSMALTFLLCACLDHRTIMHINIISFKFGLLIVAIALPGVKYSGLAMNPARAFGPAVVAGNFQSHWIYWIGPMLGAALMAALYLLLFTAELEPSPPPAPKTE